MTIGEAIKSAVTSTAQRSSTPRLDAEVLLAHVLGRGRASLLAHATDALNDEAQARFQALVERRAEGEPIAYLTGRKEFYGLDLVITKDVLVPRPETESTVEACLEMLPQGKPRLFADVGTGSGAIVVAVAKHRPLLQAYATDISAEALAVARTNCERHGLSDRVRLLHGDLLGPLPTKAHVIAANLPYVPPGEASPDVAKWEPHIAVSGGGEDGADLIRAFLAAAPNYLLPGGGIIMEIAHSQAHLVSHLARQAFPHAHVQVRKDLSGYDRIVVITNYELRITN